MTPLPLPRFEELVADALDEVPPELMRLMDNVVVLVEDRNEEEPELLEHRERERLHQLVGSGRPSS